MVKLRFFTLVFLFAAGVFILPLQNCAHADTCDAIVGKWTWFTGGTVTINPDGTMVYDQANDGTWECTDLSRGLYILRWRLGGFVNTLALSADGLSLSSTDTSQFYVSAKRIGTIATAPKKEGETDAKAHYNKGNQYYDNGELDKAIAEYTKAIEINPKYADAYYERGAAYADNDQDDQALADFNKAIELDPQNEYIYLDRADLYMANKQYDRAVSDYTKAVELNPKDADAYRDRADAYYKKGEFDKALDDLKKAKDLGYKVTAELLAEFIKAGKEVLPAASPKTARLIWKFKEEVSVCEYPGWNSPAVAGGKVYFSSTDYLCALDGKSGQREWSVHMDGVQMASPVVADGIVYVSTTSELIALDTQTHRAKWGLKLRENDGAMLTTPALAGNLIFLVAGASESFTSQGKKGPGWGKLIAVNAATGRRQLSIQMTEFNSGAVAADGVVYAGCKDGQLFAVQSSFENSTHRRPVIWSFKTGGAITSSPAVSDGVVYVGSDDGYIYAVDIKTHQEKWRFKAASKAESSPVVAGGVLYVGSDDHHVYAVDVNSGGEKWGFKTGAEVWSSPAVVNGVIYVGSADGNLYALDAATGQEKWRFKTGGEIVSSPVVSEHVVYVGSRDGCIYAVAE